MLISTICNFLALTDSRPVGPIFKNLAPAIGVPALCTSLWSFSGFAPHLSCLEGPSHGFSTADGGTHGGNFKGHCNILSNGEFSA